MSRTQEVPAAGRAPVVIRPLRPADLPALRDFFGGLSMESRYLRFFAPTTPGPSALKILAGGGGTSDVMIAVGGAVIVGHAMAADQPAPGGARTTDIGVVVADAWQRQGIGSALVRALIAPAQARGVTSLTMDVLPDNHRMHAMIAKNWPAARTRRSRDCDVITVALAPARPVSQGFDRDNSKMREAPPFGRPSGRRPAGRGSLTMA